MSSFIKWYNYHIEMERETAQIIYDVLYIVCYGMYV